MHSRASWAPHGARNLEGEARAPIRRYSSYHDRGPIETEGAGITGLSRLTTGTPLVPDRGPIEKRGRLPQGPSDTPLVPDRGPIEKEGVCLEPTLSTVQRHVATIAWILRHAASGLHAGGSLVTFFCSQQPACAPVGASWARSPHRSRPARRWELDVHLLLARRPACTPLG